MSKLSDQYNGTTQKVEPERPDTATKTELDNRVEDRRNYPPIPEHNHPAPDWVQNADNLHRQYMRKNEQRINELRNRLNDSSRTMRRDFDRSR